MPNQMARSLATRTSNMVAVVVAEAYARIFSDPFFAGAIGGVATAVEAGGKYVSLLTATKEGTGHLETYLRGGVCDGVIVMSHHRGDAILSALASRRLPTVLIGRPYDDRDTFAWVDIDNEHGGYLATRHLLERGAKHIATITGPLDMRAAVDRYRGYQRALNEANVPSLGAFEADFSASSAQVQACELLAKYPQVDGIFIASDLMATAAMSIFHDAGRKIGHTLKIVGFDNLQIGELAATALTTVTNPAHEMGELAGQMLLDQLAGNAPGRKLMTPHLLVRHSS